jgi:hypothetical protein
MGKLSTFLLFLSFLICNAIECYCQQSISYVEINTQNKINISEHVEIYTTDKKENFTDVKNLQSQNWKPNHNPKTINLKINDSVYWFKFRIINKGNFIVKSIHIRINLIYFEKFIIKTKD